MSRNTKVTATAEDLDRLTGYQGSLQGTIVDELLDNQRAELWKAQALVETVTRALEAEFGGRGNWPNTMSNFPLVLEQASQMIGEVASAIEVGTLEDAALAVARAREAEAAEQPEAQS